MKPQQPPPSTPCRDCEFLGDCAAYEALDALIYSKPGFTRPAMKAKFLGAEKSGEVIGLLGQCVDTWIATVRDADLPVGLRQLSLPALFDVLMSGLYAAVLHDEGAGRLRRPGFTHVGAEGGRRFFPYLWICPACIAEGVAPADAYLPGAELKAGQMYPMEDRLSRPDGRMIGDLGALCIRSIVTAITRDDEAHFAAGGGHRGEFDLIVSTDSLLVLGETKASPLVAFPIASRLEQGEGHHQWTQAEEGGERSEGGEWAFYLGAAEEGRRFLPIGPPTGSGWPLTDLRELLRDPENVELIVQVWERHLRGYRLFNAEDPKTRWQRFGCGNIVTGRRGAATARQLRVHNTKNLPGIDRTDDLKKGIAQVMLFGRLKHGCRAQAVNTVLFGNLYAETHDEHYVKPLASLKLVWPGAEPVWLLDGIVALSRNIINSPELEALFDLKSEPYDRDKLAPAELVEAVEDAAD